MISHLLAQNPNYKVEWEKRGARKLMNAGMQGSGLDSGCRTVAIEVYFPLEHAVSH
jgi:hypothetical protein